MAISSVELKKLRWRSRRGMQELDTLLNRYLDRHSAKFDSAAIERFGTLLQVEDDRLWLWLSGQRACPEDELCGLIDDIRAAI